MQKELFLERFHRNERLIGLSDGVFAIVMTLLVLDLRLPPLPHPLSAAALWQALLGIQSKMISFLLSFCFVSSLWFSHNQLFKLFDKVDNAMLWYNLLLLLMVCFIPFPTILIGEYPHNPVGITLFGSVWVIIPFLIYVIGSRAYHKRYLHQSVNIERYLYLRKIALLYTPISAIPIIIAWRWPTLAFAFYVCMMIGGVLAGFLVKVEAE